MENKKIITVTVNLQNSKNKNNENRILELKKLVEASGGDVISEIQCNRKFIDKALYIGKGKAAEIQDIADMLEADAIVFNNDLTGSQLSNLSEIIDINIVDRTSLILEIFANRTKSKESKLQVQLAKMEYMLPRLTGLRKNLSKVGAGVGTRGLGEQKLELDRRKIAHEIHGIKVKLEKIKKTRNITSKNRIESDLPIISLIGYTNAGKSTIGNEILNFNKYNQDDVFEKKDMLFMTLDTTIKKGTFPSGLEFLIADTVGFIEDLPTTLIESFKSTLEEIEYSNCILNIIDSSNDNLDEQIETTFNILKELKIKDIPIINVFNKIDLKKNFLYKKDKVIGKTIYISAYCKEDIESLLNEIENSLEYQYVEMEFSISYDKQSLIKFLKDKGYKLEINYEELIYVKTNVLVQDKELITKFLSGNYEI